MSKSNRREFLKRTGIGVAGIAALKWSDWAIAGEAGHTGAPQIPPHRLLAVPGVHAYANQQSVTAGQTISFHVSGTAAYQLSVCRLGLKVDDPSGDLVLHEFPESQPKLQPIHPGSYIHVRKGLAKLLGALTLECWVRPWKTNAWAGLLGQYEFKDSCGFGLFLNATEGVSFYLGDGTSFQKRWMHSSPEGRLKAGRWHHVVGTWDGNEKTLWINGEKSGNWPFAEIVVAAKAPLRLAAYGDDGVADHFLDGDLAMAAIYAHALSSRQIGERFRQQGLERATGKGVLACWPFAEEKGDQVADRSRHQRHGRIINHATWMVGGPSFNAEVPRFAGYDPKKDDRRGHGLRLASDDLYDCRWSVTHRYRLPSDARPGIYVGRIHYELESKPYHYHATFIVKKSTRRKKAPILLLAATNTWRAYNAAPFAQAPPGLKHVCGTNGLPNSPGNPPAFSYYRGHAAGQGTYQAGLCVPWPSAGPYILYGGPTDYSHLMRADRFAQVWLEQAGYDYDVVTDLDLHRDPELLRGYRVFFINGHSEYWSVPMYRGLGNYLKNGGNVICLSGNSLFWRVSFNDDETIMECRKVDAPGDQLPPSRRGECWHSQDGQRGGLLRECGHPGWKLIGTETLGWNNQSNPVQFGPYVVDEPDHFLFHRPERLNLKKGDVIGQAPDGNLPRANGHEIDVRLSTLASLQEKPAPDGATLPVDPAGITRLANGIITWQKGGAAFDYFFRPIKPNTDQGGELIYWERPEGGRVFNAGSIGAGWALLADPKFQQLLNNVLHHFGVVG